NPGNISDLGQLRLDRGLSSLSRKHVFNASVVLNLPTLEDKAGLVKNLLGNWQVTTVAIATSGSPLTVTIGGVAELPDGPSGTGFDLPASFGQATAARDPRQAQVGFKLMF